MQSIDVMKSSIVILFIAVLGAHAARAETQLQAARQLSLRTPNPAAFSVTMSRWPVWSVASGWSLFAHSGVNNGLLNPMPAAAIDAILAPLWDPWLHTANRSISDQRRESAAEGDRASAELQLSLRPGVSMLWELANDGALLQLDDVTIGLGVRIRF